MLKRALIGALVLGVSAAVVVDTGFIASGKDNVPIPTEDFARECPFDDSRARDLYWSPFVATSPSVAVGTAFLRPWSVATMTTPQTDWFIQLSRVRTELLSCQEVEREWHDALSLYWNRGKVAFVVTLSDDNDIRNVMPSPRGNIQRVILETSTGVRVDGDLDPNVFPEVRDRSYVATYILTFDRERALGAGTEWVRLHFATARARMYFEWRFREPIPAEPVAQVQAASRAPGLTVPSSIGMSDPTFLVAVNKVEQDGASLVVSGTVMALESIPETRLVVRAYSRAGNLLRQVDSALGDLQEHTVLPFKVTIPSLLASEVGYWDIRVLSRSDAK